MSCWRVEARPAGCRALACLVVSLHAGMVLVPWLAGCELWTALVMSALCLAALPRTLRAVPGRRCPIESLCHADGALTVILRGAGSLPATVGAATRIWPGTVFCRLEVAGQELDLWLPRYALSAVAFRRLKVALRCGRAAGAA